MDVMKGLFCVKYDDDNFCMYEYLECVSQDEERLKQRAFIDDPEFKVVHSYDESNDLEEMMIPHYRISDVDII